MEPIPAVEAIPLVDPIPAVPIPTDMVATSIPIPTPEKWSYNISSIWVHYKTKGIMRETREIVVFGVEYDTECVK